MGLRIVQLAVLAALTGSPASAADEVHVDHSGPAAKEYAYPIDEAIRQAGAQSGSAGQPGLAGKGLSPRMTSPFVARSPFGVGITPVAAPSGRARFGAARAGQAGGWGHDSAKPPGAAIPRSQVDGSGGSADVLLAVAVVLVGGGVGLILRRGSRRRWPRSGRAE